MPRDTTITLYYDGQYFTVSSSTDSAAVEMDRLVQQYKVNKKEHFNYYHPEIAKQEVPFTTVLIIMGCMVFVIYKVNNWLQPKLKKYFGEFYDEEEDHSQQTAIVTPPRSLVYPGAELHFSEEELDTVLNKHFIYYLKLQYKDKEKFIHRLKKFISRKTFVIHDESGFKEMPILITASAIQISFGLDKYLLPHFSHIHIFPEEFIGYHPTLRLLEGNVSGHSVNLSWKHFMNGYQLPDNGQNVGLHEFAHAFYYQYFEAKGNVEQDFVETFPLFDACGNKAFEMEQQHTNRLYSDYALRNFQEFWAESIEIFFERPGAMKEKYLDLYEAMCDILNQDPLRNTLHLT